MISPAKRDANRNNAKKSTGPKSPEGKARSARNAVTHGLTASPGDPTPEYRAALAEWVGDLRPRGIVERTLAERACRAAWNLRRCDRYEDATTAKRVRDAGELHDLAEAARAEAIGRRLLAVPDGDEDLALLVAELRRTAAGVSWLLARWDELGRALKQPGGWDEARALIAARLLGLRGETIEDHPVLGRILPRAIDREASWFDDPALAGSVDAAVEASEQGLGEPQALWLDCVRAVAGRGRGTESADAKRLAALVRSERAKLARLMRRVLKGRAAEDRAGAADRAMFDESKSLSLCLRYATAASRDLHRSITDLAKLRESGGDSGGESEPPPPPPPPVPTRGEESPRRHEVSTKKFNRTAKPPRTPRKTHRKSSNSDSAPLGDLGALAVDPLDLACLRAPLVELSRRRGEASRKLRNEPTDAASDRGGVFRSLDPLPAYAWPQGEERDIRGGNHRRFQGAPDPGRLSFRRGNVAFGGASEEDDANRATLPNLGRSIMRRATLLSLIAVLLTAPTFAAGDETYTRKEDVIYGRKHGTALTLDVFTPKKDANGLGVIFVVSGGWYSSHDGIALGFVEPLVARGYTVFAVVHGSQPKFTIPEVVADMNRAVRFIRHHAKEYGVDPERLGIYGGSAGGHLSLMQGMAGDAGDPKAKDPIDRESSRVKAVACFFPPTDFLNYGKTGEDAIGRGILKDFKAPFDFHEYSAEAKMFVPITDEAKLIAIGKMISPITHASSDDPATLIIHGDADMLVPIQQAEVMVEALKKTGVEAKLITKPKAEHGWAGMDKDLLIFADWFDAHLKSVEPPSGK